VVLSQIWQSSGGHGVGFSFPSMAASARPKKLARYLSQFMCASVIASLVEGGFNPMSDGQAKVRPGELPVDLMRGSLST
jgi:hypothetical protein